MNILISLSLLLILSACSPSVESIQVAMTQTQIALPSNTAVPTNTVTPIVIPTLTSTPGIRDEVVYEREFESFVDEFTANSYQLIEMLREYNKSSISDPELAIGIKIMISDILNSVKHISDLEPVPTKYIEVDLLLQEVLTEFEKFADICKKGIDEKSITTISQSLDHYGIATNLLTDTIEIYKKVR